MLSLRPFLSFLVLASATWRANAGPGDVKRPDPESVFGLDAVCSVRNENAEYMSSQMCARVVVFKNGTWKWMAP